MVIKSRGKTGTITLRMSLGRRLQKLRLDSGKSFDDIATAGLGSRQKVMRMEKGEGVQKPGDVRALCWLYGASDEETNALYDMSLRAMEGSMWEDFSDVLPIWFSTFVELEGVASKISTFEPALVPGLLQTADYARALYERGVPRLTPELINRQIEARMERQRVRFGEDSSEGEIIAVLDEAVLARSVGGTDVRVNQLRHLRQLNESGQVSVRVLTWASGAHAAMEGAFTVLDLLDPEAPSVVYVENRVGGRYHEKPAVVDGYRNTFASVYAQSIPLEGYAP